MLGHALPSHARCTHHNTAHRPHRASTQRQCIRTRPPPPSRAKASRRWIFITFRRHSCASTSLACKSEPEVDLYSVSTPCSPHPPPSHANASRRWFCCLSTPFTHPPPPSHAKASRRWFSTTFLHPPPPSRAKASQRVELYGVSTPFSPPPLPLHANTSWGWFYRVSTLVERAGGNFDTVRTSSSTSLACKGKPGGSLITF